MRSPEPVTLTPAMLFRTRVPVSERCTLLRLCIASPLLLMIGPGSSGGGAGCGRNEPSAPVFQIRRQEATTTPMVMRRPIDGSTRWAYLPCWRKRGPPEGGVVVGSEEGDENQGRRRA